MEKSGNKVVFDDKGSYIYNRATSVYTPLRKHNGAYLIDLWVQHADPSDQLTGNIVALATGQETAQPVSAETEDKQVFPRLPFRWE